jgi:hypothetical protein
MLQHTLHQRQTLMFARPVVFNIFSSAILQQAVRAAAAGDSPATKWQEPGADDMKVVEQRLTRYIGCSILCELTSVVGVALLLPV